jgi:hypothetical protein
VILVSWNAEGFSPQIRVITGNKRRDASFLETKASTTFNAGFRNCVITGNHDYWYLWLEAFYFGRDLMTIHLGHVVIDDHGSNRADCRNS